MPDGLTRFERTDPDVRFDVPARPTVRQQLEYYSRYRDTGSESLYVRLWYSAQTLIFGWRCDVLPDMHADLNRIDSPQATTAIMWAGNAVVMHMESLEALPKV